MASVLIKFKNQQLHIIKFHITTKHNRLDFGAVLKRIIRLTYIARECTAIDLNYSA